MEDEGVDGGLGGMETAIDRAVQRLVDDKSSAISRSTSPGQNWDGTEDDTGKGKRYRPRTYPYFRLLPYKVEAEEERNVALEEILKQLYIAIRAEDFSPGAVHWTRELKGWLSLKFEMTRDLRVKLVKLYYMLSLAPGLDASAADRFSTMFMVLTKKKHYLKPGTDLVLDWRPLWSELKLLVLPNELASHQTGRKRGISRNLPKFCSFAQLYFDPRERKAMFDEILPFFSASEVSSAFIVIGLLNILMPTGQGPEHSDQLSPKQYLPTFFHLWSLVQRSKFMDTAFIDIFSRVARDSLSSRHTDFSEYGIFTKEQSDLIFTAILRLTEIPVGQASSPYSAFVDQSIGNAMLIERDKKKSPVSYSIARYIIMSLSPACLHVESSILHSLEGFIESIDTFFHPSNQGGWSSTLAQTVYYLVDFFVLRWNREQSGEQDTPPERRLTENVKKRFVLALKEITFMGIFAKSAKSVNYYLSTLQGLAYLDPEAILPGALQRFYPSLQGLVEVHRTTSSLRGLQMIAPILSKQKGFRCHITALLSLALPGLDANDLDKTMHTLTFIQAVAYSIPFHDLTKKTGDVHGTGLAQTWVLEQMARMEVGGQDVVMEYSTELSDEAEADILRSSTAGFAEFIPALFSKIFTLLENLPDASRVRVGGPEENVINTLPAVLTPLFAALSPILFDIALQKLAAFVANHVVHQARDAMAFIVNALCKANPAKTLKVFVPMLIAGIRNEIDHNDAASDRSSGSSDVLPRDRALVWHVSMLSMLVVHIGSDVLIYKTELFDIAIYMQEKCRGLPTLHISNFIHHLLLTLTVVYPVDSALFEASVFDRGLDASDWGRFTSSHELTITWHTPNEEELAFAVQLFESQAGGAIRSLKQLISPESPVPRTGKNKIWSDEVSRLITRVRLVVSGLAHLFDPKAAGADNITAVATNGEHGSGTDVEMPDVSEELVDDDKNVLTEGGDDETRPQFRYQAGYLLQAGSDMYKRLHAMREEVGQLLHQMHQFLIENEQDDVTCFNALYTAYKVWITDVGTERSAHTLERMVKLYNADIGPFKVSGLRKAYPRPLLIKRAGVYSLQRVKHNASARQKSSLDRTLLLDLAASSLSEYTDVRRNAQSSGEAGLKVLIGGRPLVIPRILDEYQIALDTQNLDKVKGAIFTLLFGTLLKTMFRDWRFAPKLIRLYIRTTTVDKASIEQLCGAAVFSLLEFGRPMEKMIFVDKAIVDAIKPVEMVQQEIDSRHNFIIERRSAVEDKKRDLAQELLANIATAHWKVAAQCLLFVHNLSMRFQIVAPDELVDIAVKGTINTHPTLRKTYAQALSTIFMMVDLRAVYDHTYENYLLEKEFEPNMMKVAITADKPDWTKNYLDAFSSGAPAEYFVDSDHPGWLVWGKEMKAFRASPVKFDNYDALEDKIRSRIGNLLTKEWFATYFDFLKQEPRDATADRFRASSALLMMHAFDLLHAGLTRATLDDIKSEVSRIFGDGSDKHQHRATAEIIGALTCGVMDEPIVLKESIWSYTVPFILKVLDDGLTPDNMAYWMTAVHFVTGDKDPRRSRELMQYLSSFRLDMNSNAAFKESSKIQILELVIMDAGWHFRVDEAIVGDFLRNIDHPYKKVREAIGRTLATIFRTRHYEAFKDVNALLEANKTAGSIGIQPYQPTEQYATIIKDVFTRLESWRHQRTPGTHEATSYTNGSKTVLMWLDTVLNSYECTELLPFFHDVFMEQLLHMMDIKEDPELARMAYAVYRHLPNIPMRVGEDAAFISALIRIGKHSSSWHQRLRTLINMQVIYFRRIFLILPREQQALFDAVSEMLEDAQLEVRLGASSTLAGMIRCSPVRLRDSILRTLRARFLKALDANKMPRKVQGTDTPVSHNLTIIRRHAAVLGLGALVQAFPYQTPPPEWMPEVLATLASRAANDAGMIGKTVKTILADFKKTRQDTWATDQMHFTPEQLEDLEGVLWKSYFA